MRNLVRVFAGNLNFPGDVAPALVKSFPEYVEEFASNHFITPSAFDHVNAAKARAELAEEVLRRSPGAVTAWCATRDKREGTVSAVLHRWHLPVPAQRNLASKALSADTAALLLRSGDFSDEAKLLCTRRAHPLRVLEWLVQHPADLSDSDYVGALLDVIERGTDPSLRVLSVANPDLYAAVGNRPHLAPVVFACANPLAKALAAAFPMHLDRHPALEALLEMDTLAAEAMVNFLDHPSVEPEVRAAAFTRCSPSTWVMLNQQGVPSPKSPLADIASLDAVEDPAIVELLLARSLLQTPARPYHLVELSRSPAMTREMAFRLDGMLHHTVYRGSPALPTALEDLSSRLGSNLHDVLPQSYGAVRGVLQDHANRRTKATESAARTELTASLPVVSRKPWIYTRDIEQSLRTEDQMSGLPLDEIESALFGYHGHSANMVKVADLLTRHLGAGDSQASIRNWESMFRLLERATANLTLSKIATAAVKMA
jgi:hypothetical protein